MGWGRTLLLLALVESAIRATIGVRFFMDGGDPAQWIVGSPLGFWFSWSIGAAVADAFHKNEPQPLAKFPLSLWFALAVGAWFVKPLYPFAFLFFSVLTAGTLAKLIAGERIGIPAPRFLTEHLRATGEVSYSLYLWHQPFIAPLIMWLHAHLPAALDREVFRFSICALLLWALLFPLARLLYRCFELPMMEAGKAFAKRMQPAPSLVSSLPA